MSELVFQQSHIESGAGCSVDVRSEWRSAEAEDENVGGDVDDGAASTLILPVRNDCSKVFFRLSLMQAPAKYPIESNHGNTKVPTVVFPSPARHQVDAKGYLVRNVEGKQKVSRVANRI